jgi:hypothetical protein
MGPTNTQAPAGGTLDFRTFSHMFRGVRPGQKVGLGPDDISPEDHEANKKAYDYYTKKSVDQAMTFEQPMQPPQFMSMTNEQGRVIDVLIKPNGEPMVVEPKVQNTQQGMFTMSNPTNAVPIVDPRTGQQLQGYAADPMMGGPAPAPLAGGGMMATNAPAAAPTQTPAPSPAPFPEGAVVRDKRNGKIYKVINGQLVPGEDVPAGP